MEQKKEEEDLLGFMEEEEHLFDFMEEEESDGMAIAERNSVPSYIRNVGWVDERETNLQHLQSSNASHHYGINHTHPLPQVQRPTIEVGSSSSSSRTLQDSSEVETLASQIEALNFSNLNSFTDYEINQNNEASLQRMVQQLHRLLHPIGPSREETPLPRSHSNLEPLQGGPWLSMAKDSRGSRVVQQKIDEGTPNEILQIVKELKYHLLDLIKHPYGSFVILKLFQSRNITVLQKNSFIYFITFDQPKLKDLCIHEIGNRVIQHILEVEDVQIAINRIARAMSGITVALMKSYNGGYVIQQCLKLFPPQHKNAIFDVVAQNCLEIAVNKNGCCNIQKVIQHDNVPSFCVLVDNLISIAEDLAKDQYGNYVLQYLVKKKILEVNAMLALQLRYRFVDLSTDKYGSNVVEDILHYSRTEIAAIIVEEIMESPNFLEVVQHQYGNYVVQRALQYTQGFLRESLCAIILSNHEKLSSCLHGKKVLNVAQKCIRVRG